MKFFNQHKYKILFFILIGLIVLFVRVNQKELKVISSQPEVTKPVLQIKSIDTMKYSRDVAREKLTDPTFDAVIEKQIENIAKTKATHVAIGTPYDNEFIPFLTKWVKTARKNNLKVWFRGNMSGWEGWFGYPKIDRATHTKEVENFILSNPSLFEDGDIFTSCNECENGGPGDPRHNGDPIGHKQFLIEEYKVTKNAFQKIQKNVRSNFYSMNGDVARLIMDKETTAKLDGVVTVDHYVGTSEKLVQDINSFAENSGGKVALGEFGAPIPDIHGNLSEEEQAKWLEDAFLKLKDNPNLVAINYWVSVGGSTRLWNDNGSPRKAVQTLKNFYSLK